MPLPKPRKKRTIYLKPDLLAWLEEQIEKGEYKNFSHAVDVALQKLRESEKEEKE